MATVDFIYWTGSRFQKESISSSDPIVWSPEIYSFKEGTLLISHVGDEASITPFIIDKEENSPGRSIFGRFDSGVIHPYSFTFPTSSDVVTFPISSFLSFEKLQLSISTTGSCTIWVKPDTSRA